MNKIILALAFMMGTAAQAQLVTSNSAALDGLKGARKQMEAQTESQILEKLEESRLRDEANRRKQFEGLNFNVVNDGSAQPQDSAAQTTQF